MLRLFIYFVLSDFQNLFGIKFLYEKKEAKDKKEKEVVFRLVGEDKKDWIDKLITGLSTLSCTMDKVSVSLT